MRGYLQALLGHNLKAGTTERGRLLFTAGLMAVQNAVLLTAWAVPMGVIGPIRGWQLPDVALLFGLVALGLGLALFLADGSRSIAGKVLSGELDVYLARPRHPLPGLMLSRCNPASLGDIAVGLVLLVGCGLGPGGIATAVLMSALVGVLFLAVIVMAQSLAFYVSGSQRAADQLFEMMVCLACTPQHTHGFAMKAVLFTILPAGFMVILPVAYLRGPGELWMAAVLLLAAVAYGALALVLFNRGLRRYSSALGGLS